MLKKELLDRLRPVTEEERQLLCGSSEIDRSLYESVDLQALQRKLQSRGGFFRLRAPRSLSEQIERFEEFLHRKPASPEQAASKNNS